MKKIDISGPKGNAVSMIATAKSLCKQLNMEESVLDDMRSGDYDNLLEVFEDAFGDYVELVGS